MSRQSRIECSCAQVITMALILLVLWRWESLFLCVHRGWKSSSNVVHYGFDGRVSHGLELAGWAGLMGEQAQSRHRRLSKCGTRTSASQVCAARLAGQSRLPVQLRSFKPSFCRLCIKFEVLQASCWAGQHHPLCAVLVPAASPQTQQPHFIPRDSISALLGTQIVFSKTVNY